MAESQNTDSVSSDKNESLFQKDQTTYVSTGVNPFANKQDAWIDSTGTLIRGRYKGQPAEVLQSDPSYLDWFRCNIPEAQAPRLHALIINNFASPSENNDTPEHNALQAKFLDFDFRLAVLSLIMPEYLSDFREKVKELELFELDEAKLKAKRVQLERVQNHLKKRIDKSHAMEQQAHNSARKMVAEVGRKRCIDLGHTWTMRRVRAYELQKWADRAFPKCGIVELAKQQEDLRRDVESCRSFIDTYRFEYAGADVLFGHPAHPYVIELKPTIGEDFMAVLRQAQRTADAVVRRIVAKHARGRGRYYDEPKVHPTIAVYTEAFTAASVTLEQAKKMYGAVKLITASEVLFKRLW